MSVTGTLLVLVAAGVAWRFAVVCLRARADYVDPKVAARLRGQADAAAELEVALGTPQARKPERPEREASKPGVLSKPWTGGHP